MRFRNIYEFAESNATMGSLLSDNVWKTYIKRNFGLYDMIFKDEHITAAYAGPTFFAASFRMAGKREIISEGNETCRFINQNLFRILCEKADMLWDEDYRCYDDTWEELLPDHAFKMIQNALETRSYPANKVLFFAAKMANAPTAITFSESTRSYLNIGVKYQNFQSKQKDSVSLMHLLLPALLETDPYKRESNEAAFLTGVAAMDAGGDCSAYFVLRLYLEALRMAKEHRLPFQDFGEEACRKAKEVLRKHIKSGAPIGTLVVSCEHDQGGCVSIPDDEIDLVMSGYGIGAHHATQIYPWDDITTVKMGNKIIWRR